MITKSLLVVLGWLSFCALGIVAEGSEVGGPHLVPWPKSVVMATGSMELSPSCRIIASDAQLAPLAKVVSDEIYLITAMRMAIDQGPAKDGDIVLQIDTALQSEAYTVQVGNQAVIRGGNYRAIAWGTVTVLQAIEFTPGTSARIAKMTIDDEPVASYRGLLIDVGRKFHPVEYMRPIIEMCRLYKINYLQLHLNDNTEGNVMAFPFKAFPQIKTSEKGKSTTYTREEIEGLVAYADARGVSIVPELSGPGAHAGPLRSLSGRGNTLDVWNEKTYDVMKVAIGELCDVFKSSPWIHIGGDEGVFGHLGKSPEEIEFRKSHNIKEGPLDYYIKRVDAIIKGYGKKTICWEGFHGNGSGLPNDIVVMPYESQFNPANKLIKYGFPIINTAWKPLYVVGGRKWAPEYIYDSWNMWLWEHHVNLKCHIQLKDPGEMVRKESKDSSATGAAEKEDKAGVVIGAQICAWEQSPQVELPSTRHRMPVLSERTWNPRLGKKYADYVPRAVHNDALLDRLLGMVTFTAAEAARTDERGYDYFVKPISVELYAPPIGDIHYTLDGKEPTKDSLIYKAPITLKDSDTHLEKLFYNRRTASFTAEGYVCSLKARIFDSQGVALGDLVSNQDYWYKGAEISVKEEGLSGEKEKEVEKFTKSVTVALTLAGPGKICYTLNGKNPTAEDKIYTAPITLTHGDCSVQGILFEKATKKFSQEAPVVVLRASAFDNDGKKLNGLMVARTYWYTGSEIILPKAVPAEAPPAGDGDGKEKKKNKKEKDQ